MSQRILFLGGAGDGKSTSYCKIGSLNIKGLNPKTTGIINCSDQGLNMRRWTDVYNKASKNYIETVDPQAIIKYLDIFKDNKSIKNIIIDDFQLAFSLPFIDKIKDKSNGFAKYDDVLLDIKQLVMKCGALRKDQVVWILSHVEEYQDEMGRIHKRFKAVGKATHKTLTIDGLFKNILYAETVSEGEGYSKKIRVHGTDVDTCRTVPDLFPKDIGLLHNDLSIIEKEVRNYYGI